jgi:hypothetical protein
VREIIWILGFLIACGFIYQSYAAFRSVITGTHPKASGILSGVITGVIALILLWGLLLFVLFGR